MTKSSLLFDTKLFTKNALYLIERITENTENNFSELNPLPSLSPKALYQFWYDFLRNETQEIDMTNFIDNLWKFSMHLHHPKAFGHQMAVVSPFIALIEFLSKYLNNASGLFDVGPTANTMEQVVTKILIKMFRFPKTASGLLVSGGSMANLTALLSARENVKEFDAWINGNPKETQLAIMVSEHSHYSINRAIKIMGLGDEGIITIPTDKRLKIKTEMLEEIFDRSQQVGKKIFCVVGMAGTTANGSFDDLESLGNFCKKHQLWFHVDGAHGGLFGLSKDYSLLLKGVNQADSFTFNFHKMGFIPALCSALLFKEKKAMYGTFKQHAPYLNISDDEPALIEYTLECTKPALSVSVYTLLKFMKQEDFSTYLTNNVKFTKKVAHFINQNPHFQVFSEPECNVLCFRFYDKNLDNNFLNTINEKSYHALLKEGKFYLTKTWINHIYYLRIVIMNPATTMTDIESFLSEIIRTVEEIQREK